MNVTTVIERSRKLADDVELLSTWITKILRDNDEDVDEIGDHVLRNAREQLDSAMVHLAAAANQLEAE